MRLEIGQQIDNTRVRLDFRKGVYSPTNMPSYEIRANKADEFVSKYNKQDSVLKKVTLFSAVTSSVLGGVIGSGKNNKKLWIPVSAVIGAIIGVGLGAGISHSKKNKLMDKYNVKQLSV